MRSVEDEAGQFGRYDRGEEGDQVLPLLGPRLGAPEQTQFASKLAKPKGGLPSSPRL